MSSPPCSSESVLACQTSSWYPLFSGIAIPCTIIRPLTDEFVAYLNSDHVIVPEGSENCPASSELSSDSDRDSTNELEQDDEGMPRAFAFPELDFQIRQVIEQYGSVFPKLNFTAPQDATWVLPSGSGLRCTSPADVYLLLKSSDLMNHDLDPQLVLEGCVDASDYVDAYEPELVLKKWLQFEKSHEFRCFVRADRLVAICQRDGIHYDFLNNPNVQEQIVSNIKLFWTASVKDTWKYSNYVLDVLLGAMFANPLLVDINSYSSQTAPLLFSYEELDQLPFDPSSESVELRIVSQNRAHLAPTTAAHLYNRFPLDAFQLQMGRKDSSF